MNTTTQSKEKAEQTAMGALSLRDYFAIRCPDDEINRRMPLTAGAMRDELLRRDLIPLSQKTESVLDAYSDSDVAKLRCLVRYNYADDMLAATFSKSDDEQECRRADDALSALTAHETEVKEREVVLAELVRAAEAMDAHYLGSLDHQPPYVRAIRAALLKLQYVEAKND